MKKLFSLLLVTVMLLSLTACAGGPLAACKDLLGNSVNLDNYDKPEVDGDIVYIRHSGTPVAELDYTVKLDTGLTVVLPVTTYSDLLDAGWSSNMPETAEAYYVYTNSCKGTGAGTVVISVLNPTEADMPIGETILTGLNISEGFEISGITKASSVADVVWVFGEPDSITYAETLGLELKFRDNIGGSLEICFDSNGSLTEVHYNHASDNVN